jgi:NodT family efflux transporter outer membrane factor (OMF) lipoprotein
MMARSLPVRIDWLCATQSRGWLSPMTPMRPRSSAPISSIAALFAALLAVAATAGLVGCNLGPNFQRPDVEVPPHWREALGREEAAWPSVEWWHGFGSAELDDYIAKARHSNNDIAAAMARVREANALATVAGAALLPSIGASATAVSQREQSTSTTYSSLRQFSPQLSASYMIDFWGKNRAAQNAAIATATASRHDEATVELTVMSSVALTYFQSIELRDRLAVAQSNLDSAQTILRGLRLQKTAGVATALDVAQQETTVATLDAALPPLRQQLRQTVHALAILVGQAPESLETTTTTMADLALPVVRPGLPSELLDRRPDVAEAQDQLVAANANIAVARASFFPSIELTASGGYASSALSTLLRSSSAVHQIGASLTQPIFDGGVLRGQYAYSQARYDELVAGYRKSVLTALGDVEDSLVAVQQTAEQVQRQDLAAAKARRAYEIAQAQLRSGTVSILTVLNTETALFVAQDALAQARFSQMQALVGLFSALGGGWQKQPDA